MLKLFRRTYWSEIITLPTSQRIAKINTKFNEYCQCVRWPTSGLVMLTIRLNIRICKLEVLFDRGPQVGLIRVYEHRVKYIGLSFVSIQKNGSYIGAAILTGVPAGVPDFLIRQVNISHSHRQVHNYRISFNKKICTMEPWSAVNTCLSIRNFSLPLNSNFAKWVMLIYIYFCQTALLEILEEKEKNFFIKYCVE
jgi:hypothetical protein